MACKRHPTSAEIEKLAAMYAGRIIAASRSPDLPAGDQPVADYQEVDTNSVELSRPRSVGVDMLGFLPCHRFVLKTFLPLSV